MKKIFARFLLVCWIVTTCGFVIGLLVGLFKFEGESLLAAIIFSAIFYFLIVVLSFIFLGVIHPKKLLTLSDLNDKKAP